MGKLVKLTCNNTEINDLSPLIGLMSLKYVDLSYTKVKNLEPLGHLSKLQNVNCDNSLVEDIDPIRFVPVISYKETGVYYSKIDHSEKDEFFEEAARLVVQHQHGSASLIQRKLQIGFNRAGRLIDHLEMEGIVGSFNGESSREVNIKDINALERFFSSTYTNYLEFKRTEEVIQARQQKNHFGTNQPKESNILHQDYPLVQDNTSESMDDLQPETTFPQYPEPSKTVPRWISFILLTTIIIVSILIYQKCK